MNAKTGIPVQDPEWQAYKAALEAHERTQRERDRLQGRLAEIEFQLVRDVAELARAKSALVEWMNKQPGPFVYREQDLVSAVIES